MIPTMADEPDNIVLVYLRRLDEKLDRLAADMQEINDRLGILANKFAGLVPRLDAVIDRVHALDLRLERIELRLDKIAKS